MKLRIEKPGAWHLNTGIWQTKYFFSVYDIDPIWDPENYV